MGPIGLIALSATTGCTDFSFVASDPGVTVTVLYFENRTGDPELDILGKGLADMMITDLTRVDGLRVVERERLQDLVDELELQQSRLFDPESAQEIGKMVGATHAVTGAISAWAPEMRLDARVLTVDSAEVPLAEHVVGEKDAFFTLQQELSTKLVARIGPELAPPPPAPAATGPGGDEVLTYARSLEQWDRGELETAYELLEALTQRLPAFGLARTRRDEVGDALDQARRRRGELLDRAQAELLAHADQALTGDPMKLGERGARRWMGYRQVRGHLFLQAANNLIGGPKLTPRVPSAARDAFVAMMNEHTANQLAMIEELRAFHARKWAFPTFSELRDEDRQRATAIRVDWSSVTPLEDDAVLTLSEMVCEGNLPAARPFGSTPTAASLDPALGAQVVAELERVLGGLAVFRREPAQLERGPRLLDAMGTCLLAMGKPAEAAARWNEALTRYPTMQGYDDIEAKVRRHAR